MPASGNFSRRRAGVRKSAQATGLALLLLAAPCCREARAAEIDPPAGSYVSVVLDSPCDKLNRNRRLLILNKHGFRTISAIVSWRAADGKDLREQLYIGPNTLKEVGCAMSAEIIEATLMDF